MKKSEITGELMKMVCLIQKRQRISKYRAAWEIKHVASGIVNELYREMWRKAEERVKKKASTTDHEN